MITLEECEARVWGDNNLIREALNDYDELAYMIRQIRDDKDPMARGERMWNLVVQAIEDRAQVMHDEEAEALDTTADEWLDDPRYGQAAPINRMFGS